MDHLDVLMKRLTEKLSDQTERNEERRGEKGQSARFASSPLCSIGWIQFAHLGGKRTQKGTRVELCSSSHIKMERAVGWRGGGK